MKLAFSTFGAGFPVVLIHGFPLSGKMWYPQTFEIAGNNFKLILPDLPGFGKTREFSGKSSIEKFAGAIIELLDSLEISRAVIGGLSMGGYVVFELYRLCPERFSAMILADTTFEADSSEKKEARFALIEQLENDGQQVLIDKMLPNLISDHTQKNNPGLVDELVKMFSEANPEASINALRAMAQRNDQRGVLSKISIPTALIFGEHDAVTTLETAWFMNKVIADSRLFIIPKAGHYSNLEQPEQFNSSLLEFLNSLAF